MIEMGETMKVIMEHMEKVGVMSASIAKLKELTGLDVNHSNVHGSIKRLMKRGLLREFNGRWYAIEHK